MFSRKSTIIATIFIAFMYLVFVPLVYAATEYKMADYWPLKVGSKWKYNDGSIEVVGSEEIDGINTFKIKDTGSCMEGEDMSFFNDENGFGGVLPNGDGTYQTSKLVEPYIEKGDETSVSGEDGGETFTITFTFKGLANVNVPAGKFKKCLKFLVSVEGINEEGQDSYYTQYIYFANGVGMVKHVRLKEVPEPEVDTGRGCIFGTDGFGTFSGVRTLKKYSLAD